ncbi:MAG: FAD-binding oxidoreductase [Hyphomicrobiales bacterium]|nr:MAG: FAD-binding oxidoreductase [Hyphomicrobiales bacterium]
MSMPIPNVHIMNERSQIIDRLLSELGEEIVIHDEAETIAYECDGLAAYRCPPLAVVLPRSTEEVSRTLKLCSELGLPVIPRGSGTSLSGGALPTADSIVIGVSRLNEVLDIDYDSRTITVQSGITNLGVSGEVSGNDFFYAPDPSSQLACAIAGNIGMNSGGAHCLKYGVTTNNLLGVKMVLMNGDIIEIGGGHLDPAGYDLLGVICGSEGQFGMVTEATLKILRKPEGARPILLGFDSSEVAGACVSDIIRAGVLPVAMEFMDGPAIIACERFAKAGYPTDVDALLIVEVEGSPGEIDEQLTKIKEICQRHDPAVMRESESAAQSDAIWKGRKAAFGAMGQIADYMCMDGTIPTSQLPFVLGRMQEMAKHYGLEVANVFHAGDGNLHPLILYNANIPSDLEKCEAFGADILKLCVEVGGCLTGEHGVGIEKRDLMVYQFNEIDMEMQLRVKDVFDPQWLLNPAKVFPIDITHARRNNNHQYKAA